jgi:hypothetical protein
MSVKQMIEHNLDVIDFDRDLHYPIINSWWGIYYQGPVPLEFVPKYGAAIAYRGKLAATCFLYINDTKLCHLDICMVDPSIGAGRRIYVLRALVDAGIAKAKEIVGEDCTIWSVTDHSVVGRVYQEKGLKCLGEADVYALSTNKNNIEFLS